MSELAAVIKMVDEVVKPLLAIQKSLEKTQKDFNKTQADILQASYQLTALYECFDQNNKMIAERSTALEALGEHFDVSFTELRDIQKKIDSSIKNGIRGAAGDLVEIVQSQVKTWMTSEIDAEIKYLHQGVQNARENLSGYQSMTWMMHAKIIIIAIVCGIATGSVAFFGLSYKIKHVFCDCRCHAPVCAAQPAEPAIPAPHAPQKPVKKAQPKKPLPRKQYRAPW